MSDHLHPRETFSSSSSYQTTSHSTCCLTLPGHTVRTWDGYVEGLDSVAGYSTISDLAGYEAVDLAAAAVSVSDYEVPNRLEYDGYMVCSPGGAAAVM